MFADFTTSICETASAVFYTAEGFFNSQNYTFMTTTINDLLNLPNDAKISNADYCLFGQYLISMSGTYLMLTDKTGFHRSIRFGLAHKRTRPITLVFLEEIFAQGCVPFGLLEAIFDSCETKFDESVLYLFCKYSWTIISAGHRQYVHEQLLLRKHVYIAKLYE
jgi:hypothetical protein